MSFTQHKAYGLNKRWSELARQFQINLDLLDELFEVRTAATQIKMLDV